MSRKARFLLVIVLVVAFTQILWAQLPQTLEEMEQYDWRKSRVCYAEYLGWIASNILKKSVVRRPS